MLVLREIDGCCYETISEILDLPIGTVPVAVAMVCEFTFYCDLNDIHPRTRGYALMADLIAKVLPA